ncbi:MAG TPA: MBL fold metallo-hydrolase [Chitinophagaceae bacterium]|nr:MBL fold metallo-hydrolase [Chitinophagaceae bacterium]
MKLHTISAGYFKLDGGAMHGVVPKSMWNSVNPSDENNMCSWAMRCLLVEEDGRLILIDTGMGTKQDARFFSFFQPHGEEHLKDSIQKAGYSDLEITDVFLTHLHFDHCGGAIERKNDQLVTAFSNATYWSQKQHWQSALHPNIREKASFLKENILPIEESGQLQFTGETQRSTFTQHIEIELVNGHTDQMMLPLIQYKGTRILYCADLIPSVAHISLPWVMAYDMRPLYTLEEKERLLNEAVDQNWLLFFEHDRHVECCSLQRTDKGIRPKEILRIADL